MTNPGAFVLIGTEYDIVVTRAVTNTATAAFLITVPHELIALSFQLAQEPASTSASTAIMLSLRSKMGGALAACEALDFHHRYGLG